MTPIDWTATATHAAKLATSSGSTANLDVAGLSRHLAQLGVAEPPAHLDDVVLAFAAAGGDTIAQTEVHHRVTRAARSTLPAAGYAEHVVDDTIGELVLTLLTDTRSPLLTYRGQASLTAWLRTLAARTALRLANVCRRETVVANCDDELIDRVAATDLTRDLWRAELRDVVRRAFGAAITRVSYFERELLADFIVRGRGLDDIANAHDVHRATAARWMARARAALDRELRSELNRDLGATDSEVRSILDSVRSSIELSVERLLAG